MHDVGIAITTRNRPDFLEVALYYHKKFLPEGAKILVVDDESKDSYINKKLCRQYEVEYKLNKTRKGIAFSKNEGLKRFKDYDHIFLMDDDCFPQKDGWADLYIQKSKKTGIEHFIFIGPPYSLEAQTVSFDNEKVWVSPRGGGVLLYMTKNAVEKVGGFNPSYMPYGYEHAGYSKRMVRAGMTKGHFDYVSIPEADEYIWSLDFHKDSDRMDIDELIDRKQFRSSVHGDDLSEFLSHNLQVYLQEINGPIRISLQ